MPIIIPIYILLQLWFGTVHSIVVYILCLSSKNLFLFYTLPFPQVWGINSITLHTLDSWTTQGTWFPVTAGAHSSKSVCLFSTETGWLLLPSVLKPFLMQSREDDQSNSSLPLPCTTAGKGPSLSNTGLSNPDSVEWLTYVGTTMYKWTSSLRCVNHLPYNMYQTVLSTN